MLSLPPFISLAFGLITVLAAALFYCAAHKSGRTLLVLLGGLLAQGSLALNGFYTVTGGWPPRFALLLGPALLLLLVLLLTARGRRYLDGLRLDVLTWLHVVRLPVELVLFELFRHGAVPRLMTFEGRNWDILVGISAPVVYYLVRHWQVGRNGLLLWNLLGLGLLFNVMVNAGLAAPSPWQRFAFEQPNVAILYFPFAWLPACLVPVVLLAHLAAIRQLLLGGRNGPQTLASFGTPVV